MTYIETAFWLAHFVVGCVLRLELRTWGDA